MTSRGKLNKSLNDHCLNESGSLPNPPVAFKVDLESIGDTSRFAHFQHGRVKLEKVVATTLAVIQVLYINCRINYMLLARIKTAVII